MRPVWVVLLACGLAWFVYAVRGILAPFAISAVCAYVLSRWVGHLEARGVRRSVAVSALFLLFTLAFVGAIAVAVPRLARDVTALAARAPEFAERLRTATRALAEDAEGRYPFLKEQRVVERLAEKAQEASARLASDLPTYLAGIASALALAVLVPFITFFLLVESRAVVGWLFEKIPARHTETVLSLVSEIDESLGSYIHGQFVESLCVGALSAVGLHLIGIDYAVTIGGVAGFANMIPYLGPFVGSVPAVVVGFVKYQSLDVVLKVALVFGFVQFLDNNVIQPAIVSRGVNIHPLVVIFAVMAGAEIGGVLGMFLAVPIACVVKIVAQVFARRLSFA